MTDISGSFNYRTYIENTQQQQKIKYKLCVLVHRKIHSIDFQSSTNVLNMDRITLIISSYK